jgi:hypothetical protein
MYRNKPVDLMRWRDNVALVLKVRNLAVPGTELLR